MDPGPHLVHTIAGQGRARPGAAGKGDGRRVQLRAELGQPAPRVSEINPAAAVRPQHRQIRPACGARLETHAFDDAHVTMKTYRRLNSVATRRTCDNNAETSAR